MDSTQGLEIGQVVRSKAGRDKGKVFLILEILDDKYVLIVDGDMRKIENPKKKKIKHLVVYNKVLKDFQSKLKSKTEINNAYIRKLLEPFNESV
jgi:ribosomal protein L14E/L6E/L27E